MSEINFNFHPLWNKSTHEPTKLTIKAADLWSCESEVHRLNLWTPLAWFMHLIYQRVTNCENQKDWVLLIKSETHIHIFLIYYLSTLDFLYDPYLFVFFSIFDLWSLG